MDDGKRQYLSGKTRADVARKLNSALDAREKRLPLPGLRLTTKQFLNNWLEDTVKPSQKPLTYVKYRGVVDNHIIPVVGNLPLARLGPDHVQRIQSQMLAQGLSAATIHGMRTALGAALSQAERWNLVARNAVRLVDAPRAKDREPRVLQPEEATAFLRAARGDSMEQLFAAMLATGLRPAEARGLRWTDVKLDGPSPSIQVRQ
jgi:integrase